MATRIQNEYCFSQFLKYELPCNQPLDMVFMLSNGELMACCSAIFHGHKHRFSLGNLMDFEGFLFEIVESAIDAEIS